MNLSPNEILERISTYLKTITEIYCCTIDVRPSLLGVSFINNQDVHVSTKLELRMLPSTSYYTSLIESNIKESDIKNIKSFLLKLQKDHYNHIRYNPLDKEDREKYRLKKEYKVVR